MNYMVELERCRNVIFSFEDGECEPLNLYDEEPNCIVGSICSDNRQIGTIRLYEFYHDCGFYDRCDAVSGDCAEIAGTICGKSGKVLKKYLPPEAEDDTILILDQITIEKEYRGKGIGSGVVKHLLYMLNYQFGSGCVIFLYASDYEAAKEYGFDSDEYRAGCNRLISFYKRLGFRLIKNNVLVYREE